MRARFLTVALIGVAAAVPLPDTAARAAVSANRLESVTLQLQGPHRFRAAGFYAAVDQGYYRDAGLDVELRVPRPGEDPVAAVHAGKADYGVGGAHLVVARSRGRDVVALAAIYQHSPRALVARRDAGIDSLHDLAGKRVMIERQAAALLEYLRAEGVATGRLELIEHTFAPHDLVEGRVDAMTVDITDVPWLLEQEGIEYVTFTPRAGGIDFYGPTLFTTEREINAHPERVRAFVEASLRGWRYALEHPRAIVDLIRTEYGQRRSREHLLFEAERARRLIAAGFVELGAMNPGRWRYIADVHASLGLLPRDVRIDTFLWSPRSPGERTGLIVAASIAGAVLLAIVLISWHLFRVNRALGREAAERARIAQELRASERRQRTLVDGAPFPVVIARLRDGLLRLVNPVARQMLAINPGSPLEHHAPTFFARQSERERLLAVIAAQGGVNRFETRLRSLDGHEFWVELSGTRVAYEGEACVFAAFSDVTERRALEQSLRHIADTDALTGTASRRRFLQLLEDEIAVCERYGRPASVMSLDLDRFKEINDEYGHPVGDQVLTHFAQSVDRILRAPDTLGRLGGEEFAVLMRETPLDDALAAAERVRRRVESTHLPGVEAGRALSVSVGVTEIRADDTVASITERVDELLYAAKEAGRNRVHSG